MNVLILAVAFVIAGSFGWFVTGSLGDVVLESCLSFMFGCGMGGIAMSLISKLEE